MQLFRQFIRKAKKLHYTQISKFSNIKIKPVSLSYNLYTNTSVSNDRDAPPLIIMHGLFGSKLNWRGMSKALESKLLPHRKIIAVDARNHGESPHTEEHSYEHLAEDVALLLKEQNINNAVIMGHSMGGRAMMYFALKYPNLVERAIFVDISPMEIPRDFMRSEKIFEAMKSINIPSNLSLPQARPIAEAHLLKAVNEKNTVDFILQNLKKNANGSFFWSTNVVSLHNNFKNIANFPKDIIESNQYRGPVLFVGGSQSNFIRPFLFDSTMKLFPNAELEYIESGHNIHLENPIELIKTILNFVNPDDEPAIREIFPNSKLSWLNTGHIVHFEDPYGFIKLVTNFINT